MPLWEILKFKLSTSVLTRVFCLSVSRLAEKVVVALQHRPFSAVSAETLPWKALPRGFTLSFFRGKDTLSGQEYRRNGIPR